ncbi:MAG: chemotaxis-specific protein-glutamate methyltransferase CheB [Gemmatimonadaceae bacterium]
MIRILVADDSATSRALLVGLFASEPDFTVVGEAKNGQQAVEMAEQLAPDLITMDVQMPVMDGLEATKQIMVRSPRPIIIVSSTAREHEVKLSLEATRAGALMVLPKPEGPGSPGFAFDRRQIVSMARAMSQVKVVRRHGAATPSTSAHPITGPRAQMGGPTRALQTQGVIRLIAIAASTGGPAAIQTILSELPRSFPVPILVVQHIARGFTTGLAHWLDGDTALNVRVAELNELAMPGAVYIAPDNRHIGCRTDGAGAIRIVLDDSPAEGAFRPSASYLFRSVAQSLGPNAVSVILTGMGDDGISGLRAVKAAGGKVIAQDEASSVIYGMPREAARAGVVNVVLPLNGIARRLTEWTA